jgi:hypothetical protein
MASMLPANRNAWPRLAAPVVGVLFLAIYLPAAGRGFLKDDFAWIATARIEDWHDLARIFTGNVGFYRPLVTLTFSADHAVWGLQPWGYGLTNLLLCAANALLLHRLATRVRLGSHAALVAVAVWLFNFHAVNMALLWLSGRTALLVTLFSLATAHAMLRGRTGVAGLLCGCALLAKEEAVLLPLMWTVHDVWTSPLTGARPTEAARNAAARTWPLWLALVVYAVLRTTSGAFTASTAPSYYQFSFDPALLLRNVLAYADRAGTVAAFTILVFVAVAGWRSVRLSPDEWRLVRIALVWIPSTYALTVFLPIRSSLYALLPSVGAALLAAAVASAVSRAQPQRFRRAAAGLLVLVLLLVPVYYARNERWTGAADISTEVMTLVQEAASAQAAGHVVLIDDAPAPITFDDVFSGLFGTGVQLFAGPQWTGEVVPPGAGGPHEATLTIGLRDGMPVVITEPRTAGGSSGGVGD